MDWSTPSEILAVGGFKRLADEQYENQVVFYTRHGEFLYRIEIPQRVSFALLSPLFTDGTN